MPHSGVQLKLDRCGGVTVFCGATEIGQGSDSMLAAIVAEVLGIDPFDIRVVTGDTDLTPVDLGSYSEPGHPDDGQRSDPGRRARARDLVAAAVREAARFPRSAWRSPTGRVFDAENPARGVTFAEAVLLAETRLRHAGDGRIVHAAPSAGQYRGAGVGPSPAYSYSAAVVEVEVDPETGSSGGQGLDRARHRQSHQPGARHGAGRGLRLHGPGRGVDGGDGLSARTPTATSSTSSRRCWSTRARPPGDARRSTRTWWRTRIRNGPFGAKEVGQGPLLPMMPAVANAVFDAVGVRVDEIPVTPEKVARALKAKAQGKAPRVGPEGFPTFRIPSRSTFRRRPKAATGARSTRRSRAPGE